MMTLARDGFLERLESALQGRYTIEREIGRGGMATVYLARDLKHNRAVAVKVLSPELAATLGSERFLREIEIAASLNHPHILPLLDSGGAEDVLYYVMPYVRGGSLRDVLREHSSPEVTTVVKIAREVAAALQHAHLHGVVHRDIKPENILFLEGLAIVTDFGIAKALSSVSRDALTRSGLPIGTPGYMSPEQATGITELDETTDVCGLGCVVYEMLVGQTPGVWPSSEEVRLGRFEFLPEGHRERLDQLPGRLEQVLVRALAIRPGERFASPVAFAEALGAVARPGEKLSDREVHAILGRAADLDAAEGTVDGALSIGGVERVAAEAGIPPDHVRGARRDLSLRDPAPIVQPGKEVVYKAGFFVDKLISDTSISGTLEPADHARVVEAIHDSLDVVGHGSSLGDSITWSPAEHGGGARRIVVRVASEGDATRVRIEENLALSGWRIAAPMAFAYAGMAIGGGIAWLTGLDGGGVIATVVGFGFSSGFLGANWIIRNDARKRKPQLQRALDRIKSLVGRSPSDSPPPPELSATVSPE